MKIQLLLTLSSVFFCGLVAHADVLTFDFKDPKGVNNVVFQADAPLESISGTANGISGSLTLDPKDPLGTAKGKIVVTTESLSVPNPVMKDHMLGDGWLDAKKHPEITFELVKVANVKRDGDKGTADVTGKFTLKGITKEITVPISATYLPGRLKDRMPNMEGDIIVVRTKFLVNRSEFGIKPGENLDKVSDNIEVSLSLAGFATK